MNNPQNRGTRPQESKYTGFFGLLFFFILAVMIAGFLSGRESIRYFPSPVDRHVLPEKQAVVKPRIMLLPYNPEVQEAPDSEADDSIVDDMDENDWEVADKETTPFSIMWPEEE